MMTVYKAVILGLSALFALPATVQGYQIDSSCDSIKDDLIKGVSSAMELADMAKDAIDKDVNDLDPEVKRLASMLFAESDFPKLGDVYGGIGIQRRLTSVEDEKDLRIPTIFCDLGRFKERNVITSKGKVKKVLDTVNNVEFDEGPNSNYEKCRRGDVMAFTTYHNPGIKVPKFRDSIQLCPWFLNKIGHTQFDLPEKSRLSKMTKGILGGSTAKLPDSTPIDSKMYFIHVLIHEFAHTGPAKYVGSSIPATDIEYEWKSCTKDLPLGQGCDNADSYAFFAIGAYLLKEGLRVTKDGFFESISS